MRTTATTKLLKAMLTSQHDYDTYHCGSCDFVGDAESVGSSDNYEHHD